MQADESANIIIAAAQNKTITLNLAFRGTDGVWNFETAVTGGGRPALVAGWERVGTGRALQGSAPHSRAAGRPAEGAPAGDGCAG